jgi:hypothetical protein
MKVAAEDPMTMLANNLKLFLRGLYRSFEGTCLRSTSLLTVLQSRGLRFLAIGNNIIQVTMIMRS